MSLSYLVSRPFWSVLEDQKGRVTSNLIPVVNQRGSLLHIVIRALKRLVSSIELEKTGLKNDPKPLHPHRGCVDWDKMSRRFEFDYMMCRVPGWCLL